uniref:N-alpha-acetyltransferase 25, NatB auxiliary subunit n=1 Tax=Schistosoma haematobium TaxID=6185 RepID=A0A094ZWY1_SCHHA
MQAESNPIMGHRMYLPLAEKMLIREAENGKMSRHSELQVLIELLARLQKHEEAYKLLSRKDITDRIDNEDYICDYSSMKLSLLAHLDIWDDLYELAKSQTQINPDDWTPWKKLIETSLKDIQRVEKVMSLIDIAITNHPYNRGPQLARLDMYANLVQLGMHLVYNHNPLTFLEDYFNTFSHKPICSMDLAYLLRMVLPNVDDQIKTNKEDKTIYRHLCAHQIARANNQGASLQSLLRYYFGYAPDRSEVLLKKLKDVAVNNETTIDLYPVDGFLLLSLSSLLETSSPAYECSFSLGTGLLSLYWIYIIGLEHTNLNHHLRIKLCNLYSSDFLNCPELILPQLDKLEIKQLLFLSLGHLIVKPSPSLAMCASIVATQSQVDDSSSVHSLYQKIITLSNSMVTEAEEFLVAAYRKHAYTKVREFTQFISQLHNADVFLTVRVEMLHWQLIVSQHDFDTLLEQLGQAQISIDNVTKQLPMIVDCRDFSVTPNFDQYERVENVRLSFDHLKSWLNLRCLTLNAIVYATSLVMSIVKVEHYMISESQHEIAENVPPESVKSLNSLLSTMNDLDSHTKEPSTRELSNFKLLSWSVMVKRDQILRTFPDLPDVSCASLYCYGPYRRVLSIGIELILGLHGLVSENSSAFTKKSMDYLLKSLYESFLSGQLTSEDTDIPKVYPAINTSLLSSPKDDHLPNGISSDNDFVHPGGVLLILTMFYESISLATLLVSMIQSSLRPRSHYHHEINKYQKRKNKKDKVINTNSNHSPILSLLDNFAVGLYYTTTKLVTITDQLVEVTDCWSTWCHDVSCKEFQLIASNACTHVLSEDFLVQYPVLKPPNCAFEELSKVYEKSFNRIAAGLRVKSSCLQNITTELAVYQSRTHEIVSVQNSNSSP